MSKRPTAGGRESHGGGNPLKTAAKKRENNRKKKRRPKSVTRLYIKHSFQFLPVIAPVIITAFIYAWQYTRINIETLPIESLRKQRRDLIKQNDSIRLRIEQLQAPARIESIARKKLGMVSPEGWQVIALDEPMQPPEAIVEPAIEFQQRPEPVHHSAFLFGFLKRHGIFGSDSRAGSSAEASSQSG